LCHSLERSVILFSINATLVILGFRNDGQRTIPDVEVKKFIKDIKYRSLSLGEGEGG